MEWYRNDFDYVITKSVLVGFASLFVCLFLFGAVLVPNYSRASQYSAIPFYLWIFGFVINVGALIMTRINRKAPPWPFVAGIGLTLINFALIRIAIFFMANSLIDNLTISPVYPAFVLIFGLFARRIWATIVFAVVAFTSFLIPFFLSPTTVFLSPAISSARYGELVFVSGCIVALALLVCILGLLIHTRLRDDLDQKRMILEARAGQDSENRLPGVSELKSVMQKNIDELDTEREVFVLAGLRIARLEEMIERMGHENMIRWFTRFTEQLAVNIDLWARERIGYTGKAPIRLYRIEPPILAFTIDIPISQYRQDIDPAEEWRKVVLDVLFVQHSDSLVDFYGALATYPTDATNASELFHNLLSILHRSGPSDKARFSHFNVTTFNRFLHTERLQEQMESDSFISEIHAVFQPKIYARTGICAGFEALARWESPIFGTVSPKEFIPLAEQVHAIETVTKRILEETLSFVDSIRGKTTPPIRIAVNLSPILFSREYISGLISWITEKDLGDWLELEITEGVLFNATQEIEEKFAQLKQTGVYFSIDDFGTGYSNLAYLQDFEAEVIKIDKCFIDKLPADEKNAKLVRAILQMAKAFGMTSVAEGVEKDEQLHFLADAGCDQIQGFYYSKPLPPEAALQWLTEHWASLTTVQDKTTYARQTIS